MRRVLLVALVAAGVATLAGCPVKTKKGECKSSQDCLEQGGASRVCVEGRCQECAADTDCKEGFACRENRCVPKPQCGPETPCPAGQVCENDRCVTAPEQTTRPTEPERGAVPAECADTASFTIQFGFDQATLSAASQQKLQQLADCIRRAPAKRVLVTGHADERGTTQYNIALGERRAEAARKYLGDLGAGGGAMETVSVGEEKPLCTEATEDCWAKNRRAEFQVER